MIFHEKLSLFVRKSWNISESLSKIEVNCLKWVVIAKNKISRMQKIWKCCSSKNTFLMKRGKKLFHFYNVKMIADQKWMWTFNPTHARKLHSIRPLYRFPSYSSLLSYRARLCGVRSFTVRSKSHFSSL